MQFSVSVLLSKTQLYVCVLMLWGLLVPAIDCTLNASTRKSF